MFDYVLGLWIEEPKTQTITHWVNGLVGIKFINWVRPKVRLKMDLIRELTKSIQLLS